MSSILLRPNEIRLNLGIAKLLVADCKALARVGSCRHFGGVIGPEVERIGAGVAV
jgi:hypothetical protein